jgi:hypothetical protein
MAACSASASVVTKRMPVSMPEGSSLEAATMATETSDPGGATSIQRNPSASSASIRFSKPSWSTKKATLRSWSVAGMATVRMVVMVVVGMAATSARCVRCP